MKTRFPVAIGFYPASRRELIKTIENCLNSDLGPRNYIFEPEMVKNSKGFISPHAGYIYSGPAAAWIYKLISIKKEVETIILLGLSHQGFSGIFLDTHDVWRTPMGEALVHKVLLNEIKDKCSECQFNSGPHIYEHSIEVQIPFLQFFFKDLKIAPIIVSEKFYPAIKEFSEALAQVLKDRKESIVIASSDFTHYGAMYGYYPAGLDDLDKIIKWVKETDRDLISFIVNLRPKELLSEVLERQLTMCGFSPVAALLITMKKVGATKGKLLKYYTSYDISRSAEAIVGYAALAIV